MGRALTTRKSDLRNEKLFPKNNYFCYRWRVQDNFSRTVEREMYHMHLSGGAYHTSLQNERILALYKMTYRRRKNDFISQLTRDAMVFIENRRSELSKAVQEESSYTKSMTTAADAIFNILLSCSIELNTVLGFSELFVAATEPEMETYTVRGQTKIKALHARFTTSVYSLIVHGQKNRIELFVVPVEDLIGNKNPGQGREPIGFCLGEIADDDVTWTCDGDELCEEVMENLCHKALRELIEATQTALARTPLSIG
jgi:hypothetical protein